MMKRNVPVICAVVASLWGSCYVLAQHNSAPIRARLTSESRHVPVGKPIWVVFSIENLSDEPVTLGVPETTPLAPGSTVGLPLSHVFSGPGFRGLSILGEQSQAWDAPDAFPAPVEAPLVNLGPHASLGLRLEISHYYPILRSTGVYRLRWQPYAGAVTSNEIVIEVAPLKQAILWTDHGNLTVRFFYEDAPSHIDNFIELAKSGFYDNLSFHRIVPGYCAMAGDPRGDGTGIRADGRKLSAEFSNRPQDRGTVSMSLWNDDPESASCQFFITNTRVPEWDGRYTAFGELVGEESFATLDKLMAVEVDAGGVPLRKQNIRTVRIVNVPVNTPP